MRREGQDTVAYEHEFYRDTKDGNRQRCRKLSYFRVWRDFQEVETAYGDVEALTHITTRTLIYDNKTRPLEPCRRCGGSRWVDAEWGGRSAVLRVQPKWGIRGLKLETYTAEKMVGQQIA